MGVLGGWAFSYGRGIPVELILENFEDKVEGSGFRVEGLGHTAVEQTQLIRQSGPESVPGFRLKAPQTIKVCPSLLGGGLPTFFFCITLEPRVE